MFLDVWLWHFGPPQRFYGEPTPVQYQFAGRQPSEVALWWGHSAQAEVAVLWPPLPDGPAQETDAFVFAAGLRRAAADNADENSGPMLGVRDLVRRDHGCPWVLPGKDPVRPRRRRASRVPSAGRLWHLIPPSKRTMPESLAAFDQPGRAPAATQTAPVAHP